MSRAGVHSGPRTNAAYYAGSIVAAEVLVQLVALLDADENGWVPVAQMGIYLTGFLTSVVFWWAYRPQTGSPRLFRWLLFLMGALWCVEVGRRLVAEANVSILWVAPPLLLVMLWAKPPDSRGARSIADSVAWVFIGAVVVSLALETTGVVGSWYDLKDAAAETAEADLTNYWLPIASALDLDGRWAGPFFHPNHAGPVGAFLVVLGICRTGALRWVALGIGILTLTLTGSRTSLLAAAVGCAVVVAAWWLRRKSRLPGWAKATLVVLPAACLALFVVGDNWGFTGRTAIWPTYAGLWQESPMLGIPDLRIRAAVDAGELPAWASTAHNLPLDSLVRFGILGTLVVLAVLALGTASAVRAAIRGAFLSLGLIAVILTCGITEALIFWRALATSTIILIVAVIASLEEPEDVTAPSEEPDTPGRVATNALAEERGKGIRQGQHTA